MPIIVHKLDDQSRILHKNISDCQKWIIDNYQSLREQYPDQHIAVTNREVIDQDKELDKLLDRLNEQHEDIKHILIRFISKDKVTLMI